MLGGRVVIQNHLIMARAFNFEIFVNDCELIDTP